MRFTSEKNKGEMHKGVKVLLKLGAGVYQTAWCDIYL